jgi:hypothetical protein
MVFEVGRRVFTRLERCSKREGYLDPTEGDAPEALDRWWTRATQEPPVLPTRPRLVPTSGWELPGAFSIHAGARIEGDRLLPSRQRADRARSTAAGRALLRISTEVWVYGVRVPSTTPSVCERRRSICRGRRQGPESPPERALEARQRATRAGRNARRARATTRGP